MMPLHRKIDLEMQTFYVDKTGIPFFDVASLVGVAHLFFGTASAEIEDKGNYWEIQGIAVNRDEEQVLWTIERLNPKDWEKKLFKDGAGRSQWVKLSEFFARPDFELRDGRRERTKVEHDAAFQIGTRGIDPLSEYRVLAPRSTGETKKLFRIPFQRAAAITVGRAFSARVISRTKRQNDEMYMLPVFRERFVMSGFLYYKRDYRHIAGGFVGSVWAATSILLDLTARRLPVVDFAYTREVKARGNPVFSESGYLGFQRLCNLWWGAVEKGLETRLDILRQLRLFLSHTSDRNTNEQAQELARWVAKFTANPDVNSLTVIQRLKARIEAAVQNAQKSSSQDREAAYAARQLFHNSEIIKEVGIMTLESLPAIPWQVTEALARALSLDDKGWMNPFTRLENATSFSIFITHVEHIISRGFYREQQENRKNIQEAIQKSRDLSVQLDELASKLSDSKTFRAFKAVFLLDVLSKMRRPLKAEAEIEQTSMEEGGE